MDWYPCDHKPIVVRAQRTGRPVFFWRQVRPGANQWRRWYAGRNEGAEPPDVLTMSEILTTWHHQHVFVYARR